LKPRTQLAATRAPDGTPVVLFCHDGEFIITVDRQDLMLSRAHESELELARLGCGHVTAHPHPTVLVGGLGMGYTLRQALDMLRPRATVVVAELLPEVVRWNREYLGALTQYALNDRRVVLKVGDVAEVIRESPDTFDAVLLDVDNGPTAMTDARNGRLYSREGIRSCLDSMRPGGRLAIWSSMDDPRFEKRLRQETRHVRCMGAPLSKGARSNPCHIWIAER
jgi:spermidine synthase